MVYSDIEYWASVLDESDKEKKRYEEACKRFCESKDDESSDVNEKEDDNGQEKEDVDEATEQFKVDDKYI